MGFFWYPDDVWDAKKIGKLGGKSRSDRKQQAARANGAKGGRPRKKPRPEASRAELQAYAAQFVVANTERLLKKARFAHDVLSLYPFNERTIRAELIRRGRRDLWLKLRELLNRPETYESYVAWMNLIRVKPVSRPEWETRKNPT